MKGLAIVLQCKVHVVQEKCKLKRIGMWLIHVEKATTGWNASTKTVHN
jgi:hypothetical protein